MMNDAISRQSALDIVDDLRDRMTVEGYCAMVEKVKALPSATCGNLEKPERPQHSEGEAADCNLDCISRQAAIDAFKKACTIDEVDRNGIKHGEIRTALTFEGIMKVLNNLPSAQPEQLTDKEQRIFLAAMGREEKVCKRVDDECRNCREPYEDSLVRTCHEITRKVKGALWMI